MDWRDNMKKRVLSFLLIFAMVFGSVTIKNPVVVLAASKKSFITNKKFKGTYGYKGNKGSFENGWYNLIINKITADGKVRFQIEKGRNRASHISVTGILTAKINGNVAKFSYKEVSCENKGKGSIVFKKNGIIYLTMKDTYIPKASKCTLKLLKTMFKKVSKNNKVYAYGSKVIFGEL